jgi:hypothetical protein
VEKEDPLICRACLENDGDHRDLADTRRGCSPSVERNYDSVSKQVSVWCGVQQSTSIYLIHLADVLERDWPRRDLNAALTRPKHGLNTAYH